MGFIVLSKKTLLSCFLVLLLSVSFLSSAQAKEIPDSKGSKKTYVGTVALTFDDGFSNVSEVLSILKKKNIKCTFFIIGQQLKKDPKIWKQAIKEGHQVCSHTYSHTSLSQLSDKEILQEIANWEKVATEVLGKEYVTDMKKNFPYIRFPGGSGYNSKRIMSLVKKQGYIPVYWTVETCYAVLRNHNLKKESVDPIAAEICKHVTKNAKDGSIILLHFNKWDTKRLSDIIDGIEAKKLKITTVSGLKK